MRRSMRRSTAGINYLDTAPAYGNGYSETLVGEVMKTRRKDCVLASKVWYELDHQGVIDSVHASLKRLQTDHIDILQIHGRMYTPAEVRPHPQRRTARRAAANCARPARSAISASPPKSPGR